jgi:hypothetical protein
MPRNYFDLNRFDLRKQLTINLIDSVSPYFASSKTGNDLVTEKQRKTTFFAFSRVGQLRTTTTYSSKYQLVHPFSHLITILRNS